MTSLSSLLNAVKVPEKDILDAEDKFAGESSEDSLSLAALYIRSKDLDRIKRALNIYQGWLNRLLKIDAKHQMSIDLMSHLDKELDKVRLERKKKSTSSQDLTLLKKSLEFEPWKCKQYCLIPIANKSELLAYFEAFERIQGKEKSGKFDAEQFQQNFPFFGKDNPLVYNIFFKVFERKSITDRLKSEKLVIGTVVDSGSDSPENRKLSHGDDVTQVFGSLDLSKKTSFSNLKPVPPSQDQKPVLLMPQRGSFGEGSGVRHRGTMAMTAVKKQGFSRLIDFDQFLATIDVMTRGNIIDRMNNCYFMIEVDRIGSICKDDLRAVLAQIHKTLESLGLESGNLDAWTTQFWNVLDPRNLDVVRRQDFVGRAVKYVNSLTGCGKFDLKHETITATSGLGIPVIFGEDFDFSLAIMLGLSRMSESVTPIKREIVLDDYHQEINIAMKDKTKFAFVSFFPRVFRKIREMNGISEDEFIMSIGIEQFFANFFLGKLTCYRELPSEGKSGSRFYYTTDGKFMIKSIPLREAISFKRMMPAYYSHLCKHPTTCIVRYYGYFELNGDSFLIMPNLFSTKCPMHEIFDLKGSTVSRSNPHGRVKKDNDFKVPLDLGSKEKTNAFTSQMIIDLKFLTEMNFTDYSLLVGIYQIDSNYEHYKNNLGIGIVSDTGKHVYFLGLIDILTEWSLKKSAEKGLKTLQNLTKAKEISAQPPDEYAERLRKFMLNKIVKQYEK